MKLLQLNVWGGRLEKQIAYLLEQEQPDIICLQEANDLKGGDGPNFISVDEMRDIVKAEHVYMSPVFTMKLMHRTADFGNCIISCFPITEKKTIFTGLGYIANFDFSKHSGNVRNLQYAKIKLPDGSDLHVFNHHGHHIPEHKNGDAETMRQCKIIAEEIKKVSGKVILTGDFNLAPHTKSIEQINELLDNLPIKAELKTTRTNLTYKTEVCDYIFVSKDVKVKKFFASNEVASDHKALIIEFA